MKKNAWVLVVAVATFFLFTPVFAGVKERQNYFQTITKALVASTEPRVIPLPGGRTTLGWELAKEKFNFVLAGVGDEIAPQLVLRITCKERSTLKSLVIMEDGLIYLGPITDHKALFEVLNGKKKPKPEEEKAAEEILKDAIAALKK